MICAACGDEHPNFLSMHIVPKFHPQRTTWIEFIVACRIKRNIVTTAEEVPENNWRICSKHFQEADFAQNVSIKIPGNRAAQTFRCLKKIAVPTIFDETPFPSDDSTTISNPENQQVGNQLEGPETTSTPQQLATNSEQHLTADTPQDFKRVTITGGLSWLEKIFSNQEVLGLDAQQEQLPAQVPNTASNTPTLATETSQTPLAGRQVIVLNCGTMGLNNHHAGHMLQAPFPTDSGEVATQVDVSSVAEVIDNSEEFWAAQDVPPRIMIDLVKLCREEHSYSSAPELQCPETTTPQQLATNSEQHLTADTPQGFKRVTITGGLSWLEKIPETQSEAKKRPPRKKVKSVQVELISLKKRNGRGKWRPAKRGPDLLRLQRFSSINNLPQYEMNSSDDGENNNQQTNSHHQPGATPVLAEMKVEVNETGSPLNSYAQHPSKNESETVKKKNKGVQVELILPLGTAATGKDESSPEEIDTGSSCTEDDDDWLSDVVQDSNGSDYVESDSSDDDDDDELSSSDDEETETEKRKEEEQVPLRRDSETGRFKCEHCPKHYGFKSSFRFHVEQVHMGMASRKHHLCETCGRRFLSAANLKAHYNLHTGEIKPYSCDTCDKKFRTRNHLRRHAVVHTGELGFMCGTCGKMFNQRENMLIHERIHTGEKPFKCNYCEESFRVKCLLTAHLKHHTGESKTGPRGEKRKRRDVSNENKKKRKYRRIKEEKDSTHVETTRN